MIEKGVSPRVLADDLLIVTEGVGHRAKTVQAVNISFEYFKDIGAKVADNKCFTFATDSDTRNQLKKYFMEMQ